MNLKFKLSLMFFIEVGTEIIADSRAVLRNDTDIPYTLHPVSCNGNILKDYSVSLPRHG